MCVGVGGWGGSVPQAPRTFPECVLRFTPVPWAPLSAPKQAFVGDKSRVKDFAHCSDFYSRAYTRVDLLSIEFLGINCRWSNLRFFNFGAMVIHVQ